MRKTETQEYIYCDFCNKPSYEVCVICRKDVCWECQKTHGKKLHFAVFFRGGDDSFICSSCLAKPIPKEHQKLISQYYLINNLRAEYDVWWKDFNKRHEQAEKDLKVLVKEYEFKAKHRVSNTIKIEISKC